MSSTISGGTLISRPSRRDPLTRNNSLEPPLARQTLFDFTELALDFRSGAGTDQLAVRQAAGPEEFGRGAAFDLVDVC